MRDHDSERDFLDEVIDESTARNPNFPQLMEQAHRNRELLRELAAQRKRRRVSQTVVAAAMGTSQSAVSTLETTAADAQVSTIEKYAGALGLTVQFHLIPMALGSAEPSVVVHDRL
jgi:DNA-binding transcriptional regulator YiaG